MDRPNTIDPGHDLRVYLEPWLESEWTQTATDDETDAWKMANLGPNNPQISSANTLLWQAQGKYGTQFSFVETNCEADLDSGTVLMKLPSECFISLSVVTQRNQKSTPSPDSQDYLEVMLCGYDFLEIEEVSMKLIGPIDMNLAVYLTEIFQNLTSRTTF